MAGCQEPENSGAKQDTRFRPGQSGNPAGKPKGARNKTTLAIEALMEGGAEAIAQKALDLAKAGDATMIRLCLDRIAPARKDRHIPFELPAMTCAADAVMAQGRIAQGVASGDLTPSEANELSSFVANYAKAIEISDLETRLQRLEAEQRK